MKIRALRLLGSLWSVLTLFEAGPKRDGSLGLGLLGFRV